jgi:hypothetical protein
MLIIGYGGYVKSTVIPACRRARIPFEIISKNPVNTLNAAFIHNLKCPISLEQAIESHSEIILALPTEELIGILKIIPKTKKIWIEKPISELCGVGYDHISKLLRSWDAPVYVGMLKRGILTSLEQGSINKILISLNVGDDLGWRSNIKGGVVWADGIHAFDLGYQILGLNAKIVNLNIEKNSVQYQLIGSNSVVDIRVGNFENKLIIDENDMSYFLNYEYSIKFMNEMMGHWLAGNSNLESCMATQEIIMKKVFEVSV